MNGRRFVGPGRGDPRCTPRWARRALVAVGALAGCGASSGGDAGVDVAPIERRAPSRCEAANEAPIRDGAGGARCTAVGPASATAGLTWPDVSGAAAPIAYVEAGATGGDGTIARPFGDVGSALAATPAPATIVVARGTYAQSARTAVGRSLAVIGAGAGATVFTRARGGAAFAFDAPAGTAVSVRGLTVSYPAGSEPTADDNAFEVLGGATLALADVAIERPSAGVVADASELRATRVSVAGAGFAGVVSRHNARVTLVSVMLVDGFQGVLDEGGYLDVDTALIARNSHHGISLLGAPTRAVGAHDCTASDRGAPDGPLDCVARAAVLNNGVAGLYVQGTRELQVRGSAFSGTRAVGAGGDGVFVADGAQVVLDPEATTLGGSGEIVGNARAGVLADHALLQVSGAWVGSNGGPGLYLQNGAFGVRVARCRIEDNVAVGIGAVRGSSIAGIQDNGLRGTHLAELATAAGPVRVGDGVAINAPDPSADPTPVVRNEVSLNERFGLLFVSASGRLEGNTGAGNRYGLGAYASGVTVVSGSVGGREQAPDATPAFVGSALP